MQQWRRGDFFISTDPGLIDFERLHALLQKSYWASERTPEVIRKSVKNSLPFGLYAGDRLIGFARVITDCATFAWLADVFIDEEFRGQGLGVWLVETICSHEDLRGLRRWILATRDAHELYRRFGFEPVEGSRIYMEKIVGGPIRLDASMNQKQ